jgi:hypothetical protein
MVLATTIVVVERARRSLFIVGYTKILGDWELFFAHSLFRISCQLSSFLYRFSLAMQVLLIMLVSGLGQRKNTSSSTSILHLFIISDDQLSDSMQMHVLILGACVVASVRLSLFHALC